MIWIRDGGPIMFPIIALGVLGVLLALLWTALQGLRLRVPAPAWVVVPVGAVCFGLVGTSLGVVQTLSALASAATEYRQTLLAAGISIAWITTATGWLVAGILLLASAWLLALATVARPGPDSRWTPLHAVAPLALGLAGLVFSGWTWWVGPVVVAGGAALAVASARWPGEREPLRDARRVATARVSVGVMAALGALSLVLFERTRQGIEGLEALAHASPELRSLQLEHLGEAIHWVWLPGVWAGGLLLLATVAAAVPVRRWLLDARAVSGAVAVCLLAVLPVASSAWLGRTLDRIDTRSPAELHAEELREAGVRLPFTSAREEPRLAVTVVAGAGDLVVDGVSVGWADDGLLHRLEEKVEVARDLGLRSGGDAVFRGDLNLEAHRDLPWSRVTLVLDAAVGAGFGRVHVHGIGDGRTWALPVDLGGEAAEGVYVEGDPPWSEVVALLDEARVRSDAVVLHTGPRSKHEEPAE